MAYGQNSQTPNYSNSFGQTPSERWRYSVINDMLMSIGQPGIDYNDSLMDTMEGQQALRVLTDTMYEAQALGWEFNTYKNVELKLDSSGSFRFDTTMPVPGEGTAVFSVIPQNGKDIMVNQEGWLFDKSKPFDQLTVGEPDGTITMQEIIIEKWQDMPFTMCLYVGALAVNRYQILVIGSSTIAGFTQEDIDKKYVDARRAEPKSGKYNMLTSAFGQSVARG